MNWFGLFKKKESVEPEKKPHCQWHHWHRKTEYLVNTACADNEKEQWAVERCCNCGAMRKLWREYEW
jgi:hypothetical protein